MRRKFKGLGILDRRRCDGSMLNDPKQARISTALKRLGFRETRWQYIFEGQRYGLVRPYDNGRNEIHIRFYDDRIFAEYEIGRSSLAHFLGPFLNANRFIKDVLKTKLDQNDLSYLDRMTMASRLYFEEANLEEWNYDDPRGYTNHLRKRKLVEFNSPTWISHALSWKILINAPIGIGFVVSTASSLWVISALLIFAAFTFNHALPQVGRP